jgi:ribosomal protein L7/L12
MTIHLNLTPNEARYLRQVIAGYGAPAPSIVAKLDKQASKFNEPLEVKMPATGNINLASPTLAETLRFKAKECNFSMANRIPFIKALREATSIGLGHAVRITEKWDRVLDFVDRNGRLPIEGFEYKPVEQW